MTAIATPRSAYRPLRHPGPRNRWTRAAIVAALREWTAETGRPPRRRDWSGEQPERAGDAQRKWMREHPRWPSSSRAAARFGTWSAALHAAALPARALTFPTSVEERVLAARALAAQGRGLSAIARHLDVSRASAHNYVRAPDCPECGRPMPGPRASRCRECTRTEPTVARAWTSADAIEAIRAWTRDHGRAPRYRDWTPNRSRPGQWEAESPRWPSASVVCALLGDWGAALRAAGLPAPPQRWSDERIRALLAAFWAREGRAPATADVAAPGWDGPSYQTFRRRFGGVDAAWRALAPVPLDR